MAIAVSGGHVNRAIDFISHKDNMYFAIGGTTPWKDENGNEKDSTPNSLSESTYRLVDILGLKKVDDIAPVILLPEGDTSTEGVISYRTDKWKKVPVLIETAVGASGIALGSTTISVVNTKDLNVGDKIRIANTYECKITAIGDNITVDTAAPQTIPAGSPVIAGALVEGAKHVYVSCILAYNTFPLGDYRQIGVCTKVVSKDGTVKDILRPDEILSTGVLEILDNRIVTTRNEQQREQISLIIEF